MKYRLGLDVGTASIGWAIWELEWDPDFDFGDKRGRYKPKTLIDGGVRVFSSTESAGRDAQTKEPNAAKRREPRGARRNRDRKIGRKRHMLYALVKFSLLPKDEASQKTLEFEGDQNREMNPWVLRYKAVNKELPLHHVGRALFHLQQRRGFKSNRKATTKENDDSLLLESIKRTWVMLEENGARTLGEYFGKKVKDVLDYNATAAYGHRKPLPRTRVEKSDDHHNYFPHREMTGQEFDLIWETQSPFHPEMTESARNYLKDLILDQRPLKSPEPGRCTLLPDEPRAPKALPSVQRFRILQEVNNLKLQRTGEYDKELTEAQRKQLSDKLFSTQKQNFSTVRRSLFELEPSYTFNLETDKRNHLKGDSTTTALKSSKAWGKNWLDLSLDDQDKIAAQLLAIEDFNEMRAWLQDSYGLDENRAAAVANINLPVGYGHLSLKAIRQILPHLEAGLTYDRAVAAAGFGSHSRRDNHETSGRSELPYYGEILGRHVAFAKAPPKGGKDTRNAEEKFGKVANPTVHAALNEIGKVINDIIKHRGKPEQVVIEMARDLPLSKKGLSELAKRQKRNQDANDERRQILKELKFPDNYQNRLKLRLWQELPQTTKQCVYSGGKNISLKTELFTHEIVIDHILPFSRTLDDSYANKVLCRRTANDSKGNKSPFERWGETDQMEAIAQRAEYLPKNKRWRFRPDAMEKYEKENDFAAHQLNDTRYLARLAKHYVESLYGGQGSPGQPRSVWVITGRMTADLRHYTGFNNFDGFNDLNKPHKDRTDFRHNMIDAAIIGFTDIAMIKATHDAIKQVDDQDGRHYDPSYSQLMNAMAEPIRAARNDMQAILDRVVVSHKPDHGHQAQMHKETAYGIPKGKRGEPNKNGVRTVLTRKSLEYFTAAKKLEEIWDHTLKKRFLEATFGLEGEQFKTALWMEAQEKRDNEGRLISPPVKRVRISENKRVIAISNQDKEMAKAYIGGSNYCYDIFIGPKGKWVGDVITTFDAYRLDAMSNTSKIDQVEKNRWWRQPVRPHKPWMTEPHGAGDPVIMRIRKGDMLEIDGPAGRRQVVVYKFSKGVINLADHFEANASARVRAKDIPAIAMAPSALQKANAVRITVSPSGRVTRHTL